MGGPAPTGLEGSKNSKATFSGNLQLKKELDILYAYLNFANLKDKHPNITLTSQQEKRIHDLKNLIENVLHTKADELPKEYEWLNEGFTNIKPDDLEQESARLKKALSLARDFGQRVFGEEFTKNIDLKIQQAKTPSITPASVGQPQTEPLKNASTTLTTSESSAAFTKPRDNDVELLKRNISNQVEKIKTQQSTYQTQRIAVLTACFKALEGKISPAELKAIEESKANQGYAKAIFHNEAKHLYVATMALLNKKADPVQKQKKSISEKVKNVLFRRP